MKKMFLTFSLLISLHLPMAHRAQAASVILTQSADLTLMFIVPLMHWDEVLTPMAIGCWTLLPLCLLEDKAPQGSTVSSQYLSESGYEAREIEQILGDQEKLLTALLKKSKAHGLAKNQVYALRVGDGDSAQSLTQEIKKLVPQVSPTYLNFYLQYNGF